MPRPRLREFDLFTHSSDAHIHTQAGVPAAVEERAELRISHDTKADPPTCEAEPPPHGVRLCACVPAANKRNIVTTLGEMAVSDVVKKVRTMRLFVISMCVVTLNIYIYINVYTYVCIYMYIYAPLSLSPLSSKRCARCAYLRSLIASFHPGYVCIYVSINIFIYICICISIYVYVYLYVYM